LARASGLRVVDSFPLRSRRVGRPQDKRCRQDHQGAGKHQQYDGGSDVSGRRIAAARACASVDVRSLRGPTSAATPNSAARSGPLGCGLAPCCRRRLDRILASALASRTRIGPSRSGVPAVTRCSGPNSPPLGNALKVRARRPSNDVPARAHSRARRSRGPRVNADLPSARRYSARDRKKMTAVRLMASRRRARAHRQPEPGVTASRAFDQICRVP
jgi:hypothetical protein